MVFGITVCLAFVRYFKRQFNYKLTPLMIFGMTTFYALFFEVYVPTIYTTQTGDWLDVVMYFIGGIIFWVWLKFGKSPNKII